MNIYVVVVLVLLGIYMATADQRKWRCPAPGCDFFCDKSDERSAKAHTDNCLREAAKHKPGLK